MHLSEGVLHTPTLVVGYVLAIVGIVIGLKKVEEKKLPLVALFSAAFFVAGTIHIPVGVGSVHLVLNGIAGLFLGWAVFPAFLIALILQLLLFSFGGFSVLGVNLCIMTLPAVAVHYLLKPYFVENISNKRLGVIGGLSGVIGVGGAAILASVVLALDGGSTYSHLITLLLISHLPVFVVDSLISMSILMLLVKMRVSIYHETL